MGLREEAARLRAEAEKLERHAEEEELRALPSPQQAARAMIASGCTEEDGRFTWFVRVACDGEEMFVAAYTIDDTAESAEEAVARWLANIIERSREDGAQAARHSIANWFEAIARGARGESAKRALELFVCEAGPFDWSGMTSGPKE